MTYTIIEYDGRSDAIKCLICERTSYNPNDVLNRYCGNCHAFHADLEAAHVFECPECMHRVQVDEHGACPHNRKTA